MHSLNSRATGPEDLESASAKIVLVVVELVVVVRVNPVGDLVFGDKEQPSLTAHLNTGNVVDIAELGGDLITGGDVLTEIKCISSITKNNATGRGSLINGAQPATVGHLVAYGSTLERMRVQVCGHGARGQPEMLNMDHNTGIGWPM